MLTQEKLAEIRDYAEYRKNHSEAARYCLQLFETVRAKDAEIEQLKNMFKDLHLEVKERFSTLDDLVASEEQAKAALAIAVEALEWYADLSYGGHIARQALDRINSKED